MQTHTQIPLTLDPPGTGEWSLMAVDYFAATGDAQYLPLAFEGTHLILGAPFTTLCLALICCFNIFFALRCYAMEGSPFSTHP